MQSGTNGQARAAARPRFCPQCGSATSAMGLRCTVCGLMFEDIVPIASYWDRPSLPGRVVSEQFNESDHYETAAVAEDDDESAVLATIPCTPVVDPWSSSGGRLGAEPGSAQAFVPPSGTSAHRGQVGPPAWLLGVTGILLVLGVAAAALVFVVRPLASDRIESVAGDAIVAALSQTSVAPELGAGTVVVSEQQINRSIRTHRSDYQPVDGLRIQIRRSGIRATFSVYGMPATMTGTVRVRSGKIVIVNPTLTGTAGRIISVDRIATDAERAINDFLKRNNLRPTAVTLADDTLTITTVPAG